MHRALVILLSWAMIAASRLVPDAVDVVSSVVLVLLVALVGLPHGAADHRFASNRLEPLLGSAWLPSFLGGYLVVMALVVCGWSAAPGLTVLLFFAASAWHFGHEEPRPTLDTGGFGQVLRFARGGLVIWTPVVFQGAEVGRILRLIAPRTAGPSVDRAMATLTACAPIFIAVAVVGWMLQALSACRQIGRRRQALLLDNGLVVSLAVLFTVVSPVVGFIVYFCGWHSVRGLRRLRAELGESWSDLAKTLAPLSVGAILSIGLLVRFWSEGSGWNDTLLRGTFMGLSALAMPHLLLHGLAPRVGVTSRRRRNAPLGVGSPA